MTAHCAYNDFQSVDCVRWGSSVGDLKYMEVSTCFCNYEILIYFWYSWRLIPRETKQCKNISIIFPTLSLSSSCLYQEWQQVGWMVFPEHFTWCNSIPSSCVCQWLMGNHCSVLSTYMGNLLCIPSKEWKNADIYWSIKSYLVVERL